MIEPMAKAFVVTRQEQREVLLAALGELGVLHLVPARTGQEGDERELTQAAALTRQALQLLKDSAPAGAVPEGTVPAVVAEIIELRRRAEDLRSRLVLRQHEARDAAIWGGVTKGRLEQLEQDGVAVRVVSIADKDVAALPGTAIPVQSLGNNRSLVLCLGAAEVELPPRTTLLTPPERPLSGIEQEIAEIQAALASMPGRLAQLAHHRASLEQELRDIADRLGMLRGLRAGLKGERLYGVQGWLPLERADSIAPALRASGLVAAVHTRPAAPDEQPPTLVRYPRALRPIGALFDLLGLRPGYAEADLSAFFMVAVSWFAGMLIGDAGYGLIFLGVGLFARRRLRDKIGLDTIELIMAFGAAALLWGAINGSWFAVSPAQMGGVGGLIGSLGGALDHLQLVRGSDQENRDTVIKICFLIGSVHLILAHFRRVVALAPDPGALADLGWCGVLAAMLGLIWNLFFRTAPLPPTLTRALFGAGVVGLVLVAGFSAADRNVVVRLAKGIGGAMLPLIGAFGDTLSYIRLAAVGFAGFYLAVATNTLASQAAGAGTWLVGIPVLLVGHTMNIALALVAILAHGVRLNLLEFSSHAGLQWAGYPYRPFAVRMGKEQS